MLHQQSALPAVSGRSANMRARTPLQRAADYRERADQMRRFAAEEQNPAMRADLVAIAERYQSMADSLVQSGREISN
jgi:hypothetical protein